MSLRFTVSVKPGLIGKQDLSMQLGKWLPKEMTPRGLAEWCYFQHTAYCHGVFDNDRFEREPLHYHTARANHFLLFAEVVTIDIDAKDFYDEPYSERLEALLAASQLDKLLENEFIRRHCFLIVPSSGNRLPDKPNWHLSFKLNAPIASPEEYRRVALMVAAQIGVPTDHQTCKAAQLTAGTLFKDPERHEQGYHWEDLYVNDHAEPIDPAQLSLIHVGENTEADDLSNKLARAGNYENTEGGSRRGERHCAQPADEREKVVLECLSHILPLFEKPQDYDLWTQMWMSAWDGSLGKDNKPSERVCDYILDHPKVHWSDGDHGRRKFYHTWHNHNPRQEGSRYTVASLFYLAIREGWLGRTGYEIDRFHADDIEVEHISDWLDNEKEVSKRVMLQSQTGSGKTEALIKLWHRLDKPKTAVFVPTVKLATELAGKLTRAGLPATLYIDGRGRRLSREELLDADVLVTTLQTFALKAEGDRRVMHRYGLVYVEECDQLLSQFARGGGSTLYASSHVSDVQARAGFITLEDALASSGVVWMVDATMTQVTYKLMEAVCGAGNFRFVLNTYVRKKRPIRFLGSAGEAFAVVVEALQAHQRVVVAADKANRAKEVVETMQALGLLDNKRHILLTKDTESHIAVQEFMQDVEAGAAHTTGKSEMISENLIETLPV